MIVVLRDASTLARLRMMCATSPLMYRLFYRALRLPADCHMPGVCKRIYSQTISGFAGEFGEADLARLERCLPPSSVFYREPDAQVGGPHSLGRAAARQLSSVHACSGTLPATAAPPCLLLPSPAHHSLAPLPAGVQG